MEVAHISRLARTLVVVCLLTSAGGCYWPPDGELGAVVENHASEPLATVSLTVAGKSLPDIHDVGVGAQARVTTPNPFRVLSALLPNERGDGVWTIRVRFASGRELSSDNMGAVTSGATLTIHMLVKDNAIDQGMWEMTEF